MDRQPRAAHLRRVERDHEGADRLVPVSPCLHQLFEAQARRTPERPALKFEGRQLTYAELDRRANVLACALRQRGAGPDVLVGLCLERSLELIVGILGILKAGAAYVPMDTAYPQERIDFMRSDAGIQLMLTKASFDWDGPAADPVEVQPHHLAYVIYTSGSTGRPKGVGIEHRNIVNYVLGVSERFAFEPGMNHATVSTIAADLGNTVIFPALATGGCLHLIARERTENGALLAEYFEREKIDVLKIVPSHLAALNVMPRRRLILGGEVSRLGWIERLRAAAPACEIYNHYGPTETTVGVLTYHVGAELPVTQSGTLPLGKPLPNVRIHVVEGELCIGGAQVARGYLNRPELTAEKFAQGIYRTGDRVRLLPDGSIEFLGRVDHQVKVRGYRVELGEIEGALRESGHVQDAVVLLREEQLVAFVAPKADTAALREHLKARLPQYMVPAVFVALEKLPLDANGKIDRQALATLQFESNGSLNFVAPRTPTEQAIAAIWSELLRTEVGVDDDVFDLGAQSLMAMKALSRMREAFQVSLSLRNLFEHPTVAGLAGVIEGLRWTRKAPAPSGVRAQALAGQARAVVPLQPHGTRTPVFGVAGHNGDVFCYRALARNLGDDQPFYGLQPPGVDGQGEPLERVEDLAAYFVEQIRACEPQGPYIIAGYCAGGTTAFELAQQLLRSGATVRLLALFGCPYPAYFGLATQLGLRLAAQAERTATLVRELASLSWQGRREYLAEKMRAREARRVNDAAVARDPVLAQRAKVEQATLVAVRQYTPQRYSGRLGLFLPGRRWQSSGVGVQHWRSVASRTLEFFGPQESGGYDMLREPHAAAFAELFRDAVARLVGPDLCSAGDATEEHDLTPKGIAVRRLG